MKVPNCEHQAYTLGCFSCMVEDNDVEPLDVGSDGVVDTWKVTFEDGTSLVLVWREKGWDIEGTFERSLTE
jgi:hypothetical protein